MEGLRDRRLEGPSARRAPVDEVMEITEKYRAPGSVAEGNGLGRDKGDGGGQPLYQGELFTGPRLLARYEADGRLAGPAPAEPSPRGRQGRRTEEKRRWA